MTYFPLREYNKAQNKNQFNLTVQTYLIGMQTQQKSIFFNDTTLIDVLWQDYAIGEKFSKSNMR